MKKGGLGRGLNALIGEMGQGVLDAPEVETLKYIAVDKIRAGVYQPRKHFADEALKELALSIAEHGILQPLVVRALTQGDYEIIAGERRFRAAQQAGLVKVPCVVKHYDDKQALAVALIENLQRSDLNVLEVAEGLSRLVAEFSLTHEQTAKLIGRSRSSVSNTLRLLELSEPIKQALKEGVIEMGHARALLSLPEDKQRQVLEEMVRKNYTVRQTEQRVRQILQPEEVHPNALPAQETFKEMAHALAQHIGAKVKILHQAKGDGKVVLNYQDMAHLQQILAKLGYDGAEDIAKK